MIKLLIVDDSDALLEAMKAILERYEYTVTILNNATTIFKDITKFQPDLLIIDIYLAGDDGREICKKIKENIETRQVGILVFSASPTVLEDYKNYGADDFIEKPFDTTELLKKIRSILSFCENNSGADKPNNVPS